MSAQRFCIGCGCTDDRACIGEDDQPCHWVRLDPPLCSECAADGLALDAELGLRPGDVEQLLDWVERER